MAMSNLYQLWHEFLIYLSDVVDNERLNPLTVDGEERILDGKSGAWHGGSRSPWRRQRSCRPVMDNSCGGSALLRCLSPVLEASQLVGLHGGWEDLDHLAIVEGSVWGLETLEIALVKL